MGIREFFGRNGTRRAKKKAWAEDVQRGAKIRKAHVETITAEKAAINQEKAEKKRALMLAKQQARQQRAEVRRAKKLKELRQEAEVYRTRTTTIEAKQRYKKAKRAASPFAGLRGATLGVKKKKQGGRLKKRTRIGL